MASSRSSGGQTAREFDKLRKAVETVVKDTVLTLDAELRKPPSQGGTPVDTGYARANWVPSVAAPHDGVDSSESAHAGGLAEVLGYKLGDGPVFETNSAAYIQRLNAGSSTQAPAMFVEAAADRTEAKMRAKYSSAKVDLDSFKTTVGPKGSSDG